MLSLCDKNHDQICFEGRSCPLCDAIKDFEGDIEELKGQIMDLENLTKE